MDYIIAVIPFFFLAALTHSSAGFAGGSSYLAIMALFAFPYDIMPKTALFCNIIVAAGTSYNFYRSGNLDIRRAFPFVIGSVPMAYLGGSIKIQKEVFLFLLGVSLVIASTNMIFFDTEKRRKLKNIYVNNLSRINDLSELRKRHHYIFEIMIGCCLGFLSGLIGIGGGIFLAPILYLMRWSYAKQIAATASIFIFINSISGLAGQLSNGISYNDFLFMAPLIVAVFIGGQIGSHLGAFRLANLTVKRTTALIIMYVGFTSLYKSLL